MRGLKGRAAAEGRFKSSGKLAEQVVVEEKKSKKLWGGNRGKGEESRARGSTKGDRLPPPPWISSALAHARVVGSSSSRAVHLQRM